MVLTTEAQMRSCGRRSQPNRSMTARRSVPSNTVCLCILIAVLQMQHVRMNKYLVEFCRQCIATLTHACHFHVAMVMRNSFFVIRVWTSMKT